MLDQVCVVPYVHINLLDLNSLKCYLALCAGLYALWFWHSLHFDESFRKLNFPNVDYNSGMILLSVRNICQVVISNMSGILI